MATLVTGAAGVLGSLAVRHLAEQGEPVVGCDLVAPGPYAAVPPSGWTFLQGDVADLFFLLDALDSHRVSRVIHLAGLLGEACSRQPMTALRANVAGTLNIFEAARITGVRRVVFASTRTVLPHMDGTEHGYPRLVPVSEDYPPRPARPYEVMKYANEQLGQFYRERHGLETVALRFSMTFAAQRAAQIFATRGPDLAGFGGRSTAALHGAIWAAAFGGRFTVKGADRPLDLTYARDLARGAVLASRAPGPVSAVYHLGSGRLVTVGEIVHTLSQLAPRAELKAEKGVDFGTGHYCLLDIRRAQQELGYSPAFTLEAGLVDCCRELRNCITREVERS